MRISCPFCNKNYDVERGKYECICGNRFIVDKNGSVVPIGGLQQRRETIFDGANAKDSLPVVMNDKCKVKKEGYFEHGEIILNRYEIVSSLGCGGIGGRVYKCFDRNNKIEVVLNTFPRRLLLDDFVKECVKKSFQKALELVHQNIAICKTLEQDEISGDLEYIPK